MILTLDGSTILALTRSSTHAGSFLTGLQRSNCIVWHNVKSDINIECNNTPANWSNNLFLWSREHLRSNYLVIVHFIQAQFIKWKANASHWHALYTVCPSTFFLSWTALKQSQVLLVRHAVSMHLKVSCGLAFSSKTKFEGVFFYACWRDDTK